MIVGCLSGIMIKEFFLVIQIKLKDKTLIYYLKYVMSCNLKII